MRRYRKGQIWHPPTAADSAASADALEGFRHHPPEPQDRQLPLDGNQVVVLNSSGGAKELGDVLAVTRLNVLSEVSREYPWVTAESLASDNRYSPLCVLLEPLADGKIGPALVDGVAVVKVDVQSTDDTHAYHDGSTVVVSGASGPFAILSEIDGTGEQLLLCLIGSSSGAAGNLIWGMLMENHPGQGVQFDILQGVWSPSAAKHVFDCAAPESEYLPAIDWHYTESAGGSIPEPDKYAEGWFQLMPLGDNPNHDVIAVVVSLDCESDDSCYGGC